MDEFAKEAGITKRTLYKYVASKEKLVEETLLESIQSIQRKLNDALRKAPDFQSGMETIILVYPEMVMKTESRVINDIFNKYPDIEEAVIKQKRDLTKDISFFIKKGQEEGFIDYRYDSETILEAIQSMVIYHIKNNPVELEYKLRDSISMMVYGIMKRGD